MQGPQHLAPAISVPQQVWQPVLAGQDQWPTTCNALPARQQQVRDATGWAGALKPQTEKLQPRRPNPNMPFRQQHQARAAV